MKIIVKSLNGNKNEIEVEEDITVRALKKILEEKDGVHADQLRLIFRGKLLNDQEKLNEKGIKICVPFFYFFFSLFIWFSLCLFGVTKKF